MSRARRIVTGVIVALGVLLIAVGADANERAGDCLRPFLAPALCASTTGAPCPRFLCSEREATAFTAQASRWWVLGGSMVLVSGLLAGCRRRPLPAG